MSEKQKADLRRQMREQLKALPEAEKKLVDRKLTEKLFSLPEVIDAKTVLAYVPLPWESGNLGLVERLLKSGKNVFVPKVLGREMDFFKISSISELKEGTFHILEPEVCKKIPASKLLEAAQALMLVPGMAFTNEGKRLGKGGGYYDRYLAQHTGHPTVALAYEFQLRNELPTGCYDQDMSSIVTEARIIRCRKALNMQKEASI